MEDKNANLMKTYEELSETNKYLQEQNDVYKQKSEDNQKTIENLRKQIAEYKSKSESVSPPRKNTKLVDSSQKPKLSKPPIDAIPGPTNPMLKNSSKAGGKQTSIEKTEKSARNTSKHSR